MKDPVSTNALLRVLRSGRPEEQSAACILIGTLRLSDRRVTSALGKAVREAPATVRAYAVSALGLLPHAAGFPHLVQLLNASGSLREYAVALLKQQGAAISPAMIRRFRKAEPGRRAPHIRVLAALNDLPALEFLVKALPKLEYAEIREISIAIRNALPTMGRRERRGLVKLLIATLSDLEGASEQKEEAALLRMLGAAADPAALSVVLSRVRQAQSPIVRKAAMGALATMDLPKRREGAVARVLQPLLLAEKDPSLALLSYRILRRLDPCPLSESEVLHLTHGRYLPLVRAALRDLDRFPGPAALDRLLSALRSGKRELRESASAALARMPNATDALLAAHESEDFADHQEFLRSILAERESREDGNPRALSQRLRAHLHEDLPDDRLSQRLLALGSLYRSDLNPYVERRAHRFLRRGEPQNAIRWLEPLVRHRMATPRGRYLLALSHLCAAKGLSPGTPHHDRAMQLLGPLARIPDFRLPTRLSKEPLLEPEGRAAIISHMRERPAAEKAVARALAPPDVQI